MKTRERYIFVGDAMQHLLNCNLHLNAPTNANVKFVDERECTE